jgi:hypothetical protein
VTGPGAQAVPPAGTASPCACWSCDRQCCGDTSAGSCGPLADLDGRPVCEVCRDLADVLDTERHGTKVAIAQGTVKVRFDVFGSFSTSLWLDARSARHLAAVLLARAAELDRAGLADCPDPSPRACLDCLSKVLPCGCEGRTCPGWTHLLTGHWCPFSTTVARPGDRWADR